MRNNLTRSNFFADNRIKFQAYGVKVGIQAEKESYLEEIYTLLEKVFPNGFETVSEREIEFHFFIKSKNDERFELFRNDVRVIEGSARDVFFESVESQIRVTIAEFAVDKVFLHAGVVGWKGQAIVIPARSYSGKTTLVAELVKRGALYYSDEYAVLDTEGYVQPFPKWLSLRGIINKFTQLDCSVESLGGVAGTEILPVGLVLISQYIEEEKIPLKWQPEHLSRGAAMMEILPHTLPIRNNPKFVLEVLNKLTSRAIIVKSVRGEAREFAKTLISFLESTQNLT